MIDHLSRRSFLKIAVEYSLAAAATAFPVPHGPDSGLKPDFMGTIPIYGLGAPLANWKDLEKLYKETDQSFLEDEKILNPNERYLEVKVRESAYTGENFVEGIQRHIDSLNRMIENARPSSAIRAKLRRVIIVADDLTYSGQRKPMDVDSSWLIETDSKPQGYLWSFFTDANGNTVFSRPEGNLTQKSYFFPRKIDSLFGKSGFINFLDVHEMTHSLLNLPDEYFFDTQLGSVPFPFRNFRLGTGYNTEPRMSPFSSIRLESLRKMARSKIGNGGIYAEVFGEIPRDLDLAIYDVDGNKIEGAQAFVLEPDPAALKTGDDYFWRQRIAKRPVGPYALRWNSWQRDSYHSLTQPKILQYQGQAYPWYPTNVVIDSRAGSLHLPFAAFNMSEWSGLKSASYEIHFKKGSQGLNLGMDTQVLEMIDEGNLKDSPYHYATMKVDGTSTYFVWSLATG